MSKQKRTIALDFDGVLHKYDGWQNGKIDGPIPGAREAVDELRRQGNTVVIFSTRDPDMIQSWLVLHGFPQNLEITNIKKPFYVIVDDRAVSFNGEWSESMLQSIAKFEPYWIKARRSKVDWCQPVQVCLRSGAWEDAMVVYVTQNGGALLVYPDDTFAGHWSPHAECLRNTPKEGA